MDNADVFMLFVRPTRVPVLGEGVSMGFQGQVGVETWSWSFHNDKERQASEEEQSNYDKQKQFLSSRPSADARREHALIDHRRAMQRARIDYQKSLAEASPSKHESIGKSFEKAQRSLQESFDKQLKDIDGVERAKSWADLESERRAQQIESLERNRNFEFTFTKRLDISTTQLLNSMKAGDVFPSATITIYQRSAGTTTAGGALAGAAGASLNMGMSLVINLQKVRLLDYEMKVEVSDTMTDMKESWTAEFGSLAYVYTPRGATHAAKGAAQSVVQTATQVLPRAFAMKNVGSPL